MADDQGDLGQREADRMPIQGPAVEKQAGAGHAERRGELVHEPGSNADVVVLRSLGGLGQAQHLVERGEIGGRLAHERGPGRVRAIPRSGSADVQDDRVAVRDHALAGAMVRARGVRPRGDDRKVGGLMAGCQQQLADPGADLRLGASG